VWILQSEEGFIELGLSSSLPPNLGLAYETLENPSLEEKEKSFCAQRFLIFTERGQLLCMRCTGTLSHEAKSRVPNQPPCPSSRCPFCQQLRSGRAHPPQPPEPVGGRARALCQLRSGSAALWTNA